MNYTQEQKELILDNLFNGVVHFNIYCEINVKRKNYYLYNVCRFYENENKNNYREVKDLIEGILRKLPGIKEITGDTN